MKKDLDVSETLKILNEIKNYCENRPTCRGCYFYPCALCDIPAYWDVKDIIEKYTKLKGVE